MHTKYFQRSAEKEKLSQVTQCQFDHRELRPVYFVVRRQMPCFDDTLLFYWQVNETFTLNTIAKKFLMMMPRIFARRSTQFFLFFCLSRLPFPEKKKYVSIQLRSHSKKIKVHLFSLLFPRERRVEQNLSPHVLPHANVFHTSSVTSKVSWGLMGGHKGCLIENFTIHTKYN